MKDKLLTLINACLDNKKFYNIGNEGVYTKNITKESIHIYYREYFDKKRSRVSFNDKSLENFSYVGRSDKDIEKFRILERARYFIQSEQIRVCQSSPNLSSLSGDITIEFDELPKIEILLKHNKISEKDYTIEKDIEFPKKYNIFRLKRFRPVQVTSYKFDINEITYEPHYQIKSGTISEYITVDEFNSLYDKFISNRERLQKEFDESKIEERIEKYKN